MTNNLNEIKEALNSMLSHNRFNDFFTYLSEVVDPRAPVMEDIIYYQGQIRDIEEKQAAGLTYAQDSQIQHNKVRRALIALVRKLKSQDLVGQVPPQEEPVSPSKTDAEIQGITQQIDLLTLRMNSIRKALALETDPSRQFAYEQQIKDIENQILTLKEQLK